MITDFKQKYSERWEHSNARELLAASWLSALGLQPRPIGHGTLSSERLPYYHVDVTDKYDFIDPTIPALFEVTGTDWRRHQSAKRFKIPVIPVLKAKVDYAHYHGLERYLWFVAVAEYQGEIRLLPCTLASQYPLGRYARGEGEYYLIPWDAWWTPARALEKLVRK
ncbi:MAG: nuclease [Candidatus Methanomethylicaceae archaeon]